MANEQNLIPAKKGEVRNPRGRGKGNKNIATILREFLNQPDKEMPELTVLQRTLLRLIEKSHKGDLAALNMMMDRLEGKPKQHTTNENIDTTYEDYLKKLKERGDE